MEQTGWGSFEDGTIVNPYHYSYHWNVAMAGILWPHKGLVADLHL